MKILDKYVVSEIVFPLISGILAFSFILSGSTILPKLVSDAIKYNIPVQDILLLISLKMPYVFSLAIPMATLFATITVFGRLGNDLEIIALRANGINVIRLLYPIVIIGMVISLVAFTLMEVVVPRASTTASTIFLNYKVSKKTVLKKNIDIMLKDKAGKPSRTISIGEMDNEKLRDITVIEYENGQLVRLIRADKGSFIAGGSWNFFDGIMHHFHPKEPAKITVIKFVEEVINMKLNPLTIQNRKKKVEEMTRKELIDRIEFEAQSGKDPIKIIMDYHMKLSVSFSCLIYAILGTAMGLTPHRSSSALGLGLSLLIILLYVILGSIAMAIGLLHLLPPILAAWIPNIVIGTLGLILLRKRAMQ
ncbi:hypothetical protein DID76_00205 [Candidatus Marinamargulisbacteria bacterium SCGC AG-414-C22]|nr:hypothetical protein DID76_00205 [Candidatus Marinamargulisbacteria bacterium SCGC AG-414-C22]